MTISEIFLEEMTSRAVLRMAKVGGMGELNEEAAGYYSQMYMTIKREVPWKSLHVLTWAVSKMIPFYPVSQVLHK